MKGNLVSFFGSWCSARTSRARPRTPVELPSGTAFGKFVPTKFLRCKISDKLVRMALALLVNDFSCNEIKINFYFNTFLKYMLTSILHKIRITILNAHERFRLSPLKDRFNDFKLDGLAVG